MFVLNTCVTRHISIYLSMYLSISAMFFSILLFTSRTHSHTLHAHTRKCMHGMLLMSLSYNLLRGKRYSLPSFSSLNFKNFSQPAACLRVGMIFFFQSLPVAFSDMIYTSPCDRLSTVRVDAGFDF